MLVMATNNVENAEYCENRIHKHFLNGKSSTYPVLAVYFIMILFRAEMLFPHHERNAARD